MEFKTLEQIKEEVSKELLHPYRTWAENARFSNEDNICVLEDSGAIDEAMVRYAKQFKNSLSQLLVVISEGYVKSYEGGFEEWEKELAKVTEKCKLLVEI